MATITRVSTVLTKARAVLDCGWTKGEMGRGSKKRGHPLTFCAHGALLEALGARWAFERPNTWDSNKFSLADDERYLFDRAVQQLDAIVWETAEGTSPASIMEFSDHHKTRKAQVLAVFDEAILRARRAEQRARKRASRATA